MGKKQLGRTTALPKKPGWLRAATSALLSNAIPGTLYHYTNHGGLIGILRGQKLWATNINYLNDLSEITLVFTLALKSLKTGKYRFKKKAKIPEVAEVLEELERDIGEDIYVCSLSDKEDDLSQWRGYSIGGIGYSIGFDGKILENISNKQTMNSKGPKILAPFELKKCLYSNEPSAESQIEYLILGIDQFINNNPRCNEATIKAFVRKEAGSIVTFLKHQKFAAEQEWRLASIGKINENSDKLEFREGKSMMVPFFEFSFMDRKALLSGGFFWKSWKDA